MIIDTDENRGARSKWQPPKDFSFLTDEEYLAQQRYIRDLANEYVVTALERGQLKGTSGFQYVASRAQEDIERIEAKLLKSGQLESDGTKIGFDLSLPEQNKTEPGRVTVDA
jgi:hypothetical protein